MKITKNDKTDEEITDIESTSPVVEDVPDTQHKPIIVNGLINKEFLSDLYKEGLKLKAAECKRYMMLKLVEAAMEGSCEARVTIGDEYSPEVIDITLGKSKSEGYNAHKVTTPRYTYAIKF